MENRTAYPKDYSKTFLQTTHPLVYNKNNKDFMKKSNSKDKSTTYYNFDEKYLIRDKLLKYEDYKNTSSRIMNEYQCNSERKDHNFSTISNSKLFSDTDSKKLSSLNNKSQFQLHSSEESMMKINIGDEEYKNPQYSMVTLNKNRMIYNCMSYNQKHREIDKLKEIITQIDENKNLPRYKVKITNTAPKYLESYPTKNTTQLNPSKEIGSTSPGKNLNNPNQKQLQLYGIINYDKETSITNMFGYYIYSRKNFPEGREQFSWCIDGNEIALYGGLTTSQSNTIWTLDPSVIEWKKVESKNTPGNLRYGHTIILYQKKLFIFGGRTKFHSSFYFPDLEIFDLEDRLWSNPQIYTSNSLKFRRNHVAKIIGQHMLIHGGISEDEEFMSDTHLLSFHPLKWVKVSFGPDDQPPPLCWHTCCLVLPNDQLYSPKLSIFKLPDQNFSRKTVCKIKEKGMYFFGGKYMTEGELTNGVWVMRIGKSVFQWVKITTVGEPPCPRYSHSMSFYEEGNYLIIHGGRNDASIDGYALNDTFMLDLWSFNWIRVNFFFDSASAAIYKRCSHSSLVYSMIIIEKLFII